MAALAFDVLESDLPLRIAFPLLMSNTLRWLAGERPDSASSVSAGETVTLAENERISPEPLIAPPTKPAAAISTRVFQPQRNGYYAIMAGDSTRWLAVNTFSAVESDLRGSGGDAVASAPIHAPESFAGLPPWQWLSLAALVLFTTEWWLFHRRKTE
jgi:hypothetical protein